MMEPIAEILSDVDDVVRAFFFFPGKRDKKPEWMSLGKDGGCVSCSLMFCNSEVCNKMNHQWKPKTQHSVLPWIRGKRSSGPRGVEQSTRPQRWERCRPRVGWHTRQVGCAAPHRAALLLSLTP